MASRFLQIMRAIGEADGAELLYYVQIDSRLYGVHADTALHATMEVLVGIGDPDTWPGECEVWIAGPWHKPAEVTLVPRHGVMAWSYEGELRNGKPHGQGVMTRYDCGLRNGRPPHGQSGVWVRVHDDDVGENFVVWPEWVDEFPRYEVKWLSDTRASRLAIARDRAPWCYEGDFRNGRPHGRGVVTFRGRGDRRAIRLEGNFRNGKLHGQGVMTFPVGLTPAPYVEDRDRPSNREGRYEGDFRNELPHGQGVMTFTHGERREGEFRNGKLHGQGVITGCVRRGCRREGEFRNGKLHGWGVEDGWPEDPVSGSRYEGEFRKGLRHGRGVMSWSRGPGEANEMRYEGEFRRGRPREGVMTYPNGRRSEVKYYDNIYVGEGRYYPGFVSSVLVE